MLIRLPIRLWVILFIGLLTILLAGPLWQLPGLPWAAADATSHTHRSAAVFRAFGQGVYWPRWFPTVYNGLGAPTFHHYSPGLYWLVAAVHGAGIRLDQALKFVLSAALLLSGFGVYAWLRYAFSPVASLAGAALFLFHPYIWTRAFYFIGDHPQLLGLLLLPVCLWAFTALHTQSRIRHWVAAVVTLAALAVSHNLTAMVGAGALSLYWLLLAAGYRRPDGLLRCAVAALLAALLSAGFWLPALADLPLVQIDKAREEYLSFQQSFSQLAGPLISPVSFSGQAGGRPSAVAHHLRRSILAGSGGRSCLCTVRGAHQKDRPGLGASPVVCLPWRCSCSRCRSPNHCGRRSQPSVFFSFPFVSWGSPLSARCPRPRWPLTYGRPVGAGCRASP